VHREVQAGRPIVRSLHVSEVFFEPVDTVCWLEAGEEAMSS
jgi:hypothetical protein